MDWLLVQLRAFDKFAGFKRSLMEDDAHARAALLDMLEKHVAFIAEDPAGQRLGFIAGYKSGHPFNPHLRVLTESFWWVAPEHRGSGAGHALLNEFDAYGRRYCDWTIMTLEHHSPVSPRHLIKRGYMPREQSYLLEA